MKSRFVSGFAVFISFVLIAISSTAQDFSEAWNFPAKGFQGYDALFFDADTNGTPDVLIVDGVKDSPLFINDGTGNLAWKSDCGLGSGFSGAIGDVNGDGKPDLVFGRLGVSTYTNSGDATFTFDESFASGYGASYIALADFDGDTHLDVLVTDTGTDDALIYTNDGSGVFSESPATFPIDQVHGATVGDVNQDGWTDVLIWDFYTNALYLGQTGLVFAAGVAPQTTPADDIEIADLDGDLWPDLWIAGAANVIWLNDGAGGFPTGTVYGGGGSYTEEVELYDLNGDTNLDAVVVTRNASVNEVWLNDGSGGFTLGSGDGFGATPGLGIGIGDLDGDLDPDAVLAANDGPASLFLRVPAAMGGPFRHEAFLTGGVCWDADAGDVDQDGDVDIVAVLGDGIFLLENDSNGVFEIQYPAFLNGQEGPIALFDADNDDDPDLIARNPDADHFRVYENDGAGNYSLAGSSYAAVNPSDVVPADLDDDGWMDLLVTTRPLGLDPGQNFWLKNNSNNTFTVVTDFGTGSTQCAAAGDLNDDGDLDVVLGNTKTNTVWRQTGSGNFIQATQHQLGNTFTHQVVIEDFTGDDEKDILTFENGWNYLYINQGNGTNFTETFVTISGSLNTGSGVAIDADGDGDLDIWEGNGFTYEQSDRLFLNDSNGVFTLGASFTPRETKKVLAADFDGDGLDDVWVGSAQGDHALYSRKVNPIVEYAESFGLTGDDTDPFADPDEDKLLNWAEFAFNLNPDFSDNLPVATNGAAGSPYMGFGYFAQGNDQYIEGRAVRPIGVSTITYELKVGDDLTFPLLAPGNAGSVAPINDKYERITLWRFFSSAGDIEFGRVEVKYNP